MESFIKIDSGIFYANYHILLTFSIFCCCLNSKNKRIQKEIENKNKKLNKTHLKSKLREAAKNIWRKRALFLAGVMKQ